MPTTVKHTNQVARLSFRLPAETKKRIEHAALVSGVTVTDFAITALAGAAQEVLERHHTTVLSDCDRDIFLKLLEEPPEPNQALKKAVKEFKKRVVKR